MLVKISKNFRIISIFQPIGNFRKFRKNRNFSKILNKMEIIWKVDHNQSFLKSSIFLSKISKNSDFGQIFEKFRFYKNFRNFFFFGQNFRIDFFSKISKKFDFSQIFKKFRLWSQNSQNFDFFENFRFWSNFKKISTSDEFSKNFDFNQIFE